MIALDHLEVGVVVLREGFTGHHAPGEEVFGHPVLWAIGLERVCEEFVAEHVDEELSSGPDRGRFEWRNGTDYCWQQPCRSNVDPQPVGCGVVGPVSDFHQFELVRQCNSVKRVRGFGRGS